MNPKVFLSHASEDKEGFVLKFAEKLCADGIDVWLDKWEMKLGDSLVDKIFEEGIKNADSILVILSKISVQKPWVREEMNAAFIKRITEKIKLIPIIINDCEIPESLKSIYWIKIKDPNNYEDEYDEIKRAIFGTSNKPPMGQLPRHMSSNQYIYNGLNKTDSLIFELLSQLFFEQDSFTIGVSELKEKIREYEISDSEFFESIEILNASSYINAKNNASGKPVYISSTPYGIKLFSERYFKEYDKYKKGIILLIINENIGYSFALAEKLEISNLLVNVILEDLVNDGFIKVNRAANNITIIGKIEAALMRFVRENYR